MQSLGLESQDPYTIHNTQYTEKFIGDRIAPREMGLLKGDLVTAIQQGHANDRIGP